MLKMSLAGSAHQAQLMQLLKTAGDDVIQTSAGLCVKTSKTSAELEALISENEMSGIQVEPYDDTSPTATHDVETFVKG
jgi:hypothetical protein